MKNEFETLSHDHNKTKKKELKVITNEKILLLKEIESAKNESDKLKKNTSRFNEILEKFKIDTKKLDEMFTSKKDSLNNECVGYNRDNHFIITHRPTKKPHTLLFSVVPYIYKGVRKTIQI